MNKSLPPGLALAGAMFVAMATPALQAQPAAASFLVAQAASDMVDAEVRKLDRERGRVTLKHGEIKALDMPPMTMVFNVADKALLDRLAEGARVKVRVEQIGGRYVVTAVQAAP